MPAKSVEVTQIVTIEEVSSSSPSLDYNSTARVYPQIIAAGVAPSKIDQWDDTSFDIVALAGPRQSQA